MCKWLADIIKKLIQAAAEWVEKCIPEYEPSAWNDGNGIEHNNNCYNYGWTSRPIHMRNQDALMASHSR